MEIKQYTWLATESLEGVKRILVSGEWARDVPLRSVIEQVPQKSKALCLIPIPYFSSQVSGGKQNHRIYQNLGEAVEAL